MKQVFNLYKTGSYFIYTISILVNGFDHGLQDIFDKLLEPIVCYVYVAMLCFILARCWEPLTKKNYTVGTREDKTQTRQSDCSCTYT